MSDRFYDCNGQVQDERGRLVEKVKPVSTKLIRQDLESNWREASVPMPLAKDTDSWMEPSNSNCGALRTIAPAEHFQFSPGGATWRRIKPDTTRRLDNRPRWPDFELIDLFEMERGMMRECARNEKTVTYEIIGWLKDWEQNYTQVSFRRLT